MVNALLANHLKLFFSMFIIYTLIAKYSRQRIELRSVRNIF